MGTKDNNSKFQLAKLSIDYKITIPKKFRNYLMIAPGQSLKIYYSKGSLLVVPLIDTYKKEFKKFLKEVKDDLGHELVVV